MSSLFEWRASGHNVQQAAGQNAEGTWENSSALSEGLGELLTEFF